MANIKTIFELINDQPFFDELPDADVEMIAGCGRNVHYEAGNYLAREGDPADTFFYIREGNIAIELQIPGHGGRILQTLDGGQIVGWSWIFPPYRWTFDVRAATDLRAIAFDGKCLRGKCEAYPALGYRLMQRFAMIMSERVRTTRVQLLDLYGGSPGGDANA